MLKIANIKPDNCRILTRVSKYLRRVTIRLFGDQRSLCFLHIGLGRIIVSKDCANANKPAQNQCPTILNGESREVLGENKAQTSGNMSPYKDIVLCHVLSNTAK